MTYAEKLKDPRWQRKRLEVMKKDRFTCRDCNSTEKTLHVHHCFYERGAPWDTSDELLITVCDECHETRQRLEDDARKALGYMFAQLSQSAITDFGHLFRLEAASAISRVDPAAMPLMRLARFAGEWMSVERLAREQRATTRTENSPQVV